MAQLAGTFGLLKNTEVEQDWDGVKDLIAEMKTTFVVNQVAPQNDFLVHLHGKNCEKYRQIKKSASSSKEITAMQDDINGFVSHLFYERLSTLTGIDIGSDDHKKAR